MPTELLKSGLKTLSNNYEPKAMSHEPGARSYHSKVVRLKGCSVKLGGINPQFATCILIQITNDT